MKTSIETTLTHMRRIGEIRHEFNRPVGYTEGELKNHTVRGLLDGAIKGLDDAALSLSLLLCQLPGLICAESIVKYSKPCAGEEGLLFKVLEANADRMQIYCINSGLAFPPVETVLASDIVLVTEGK